MAKEIAPRITVDLAIRSGSPVIQGTGAPLEIILSKLAGSTTTGAVVAEFDITAEDVRAMLRDAYRSHS